MEQKDKLSGQFELLNKLRELRPTTVAYYAVMPISDMLVVLFVGFKLAGIGSVAHWSWWWVTAPFWLSIMLSVIKNFALKVRLKMKSM